MTTTAPASTSSRSVLRALRLDLRLHAGMFATTVVLSIVALVVAALWSRGLTDLATAWAALALCRYGRRDSAESAALRAGLRISRADALRGRLALVGIEGALLILVSTAGVVLRLEQVDYSTGAFALLELGGVEEPGPVHLVLGSLLTALLAAASLVVSWLPLGKECLTRRPGRSMYVLSLLSFAGSSLLVFLIHAGVLGATWLALASTGLTPPTRLVIILGVGAALAAVVLLTALALLRRRSRLWIHELDSAGR